jgi:hypothetical protein
MNTDVLGNIASFCDIDTRLHLPAPSRKLCRNKDFDRKLEALHRGIKVDMTHGILSVNGRLSRSARYGYGTLVMELCDTWYIELNDKIDYTVRHALGKQECTTIDMDCGNYRIGQTDTRRKDISFASVHTRISPDGESTDAVMMIRKLGWSVVSNLESTGQWTTSILTNDYSPSDIQIVQELGYKVVD